MDLQKAVRGVWAEGLFFVALWLIMYVNRKETSHKRVDVQAEELYSYLGLSQMMRVKMSVRAVGTDPGVFSTSSASVPNVSAPRSFPLALGYTLPFRFPAHVRTRS
jgi:hypothetical protein